MSGNLIHPCQPNPEQKWNLCSQEISNSRPGADPVAADWGILRDLGYFTVYFREIDTSLVKVFEVHDFEFDRQGCIAVSQKS